jgi:PAS domain-containing protein
MMNTPHSHNTAPAEGQPAGPAAHKVKQDPGAGAQMFGSAMSSIRILISCDSQGVITYWSPQAARMYELPAEQAIGRKLWDILLKRKLFSTTALEAGRE